MNHHTTAVADTPTVTADARTPWQVRVLSSGVDTADVLVRWTVSPGLGQGWFRVGLVRAHGRWRAAAVTPHLRRP